jgi:hypothetical protein
LSVLWVAYVTHSTLKSVPNSSTNAADSSNGVTNTDAVDAVVCAPDHGWKFHPKHVEQFPDINILCNFASRRIYIGVLLEAHPFLHISWIRVKCVKRLLKTALVTVANLQLRRTGSVSLFINMW